MAAHPLPLAEHEARLVGLDRTKMSGVASWGRRQTKGPNACLLPWLNPTLWNVPWRVYDVAIECARLCPTWASLHAPMGIHEADMPLVCVCNHMSAPF